MSGDSYMESESVAASVRSKMGVIAKNVSSRPVSVESTGDAVSPRGYANLLITPPVTDTGRLHPPGGNPRNRPSSTKSLTTLLADQPGFK